MSSLKWVREGPGGGVHRQTPTLFRGSGYPEEGGPRNESKVELKLANAWEDPATSGTVNTPQNILQKEQEEHAKNGIRAAPLRTHLVKKRRMKTLNKKPGKGPAGQSRPPGPRI